MGYLQKLSGIPALIAIVALGLAGVLLGSWPFLRKVAWGGVAVLAVLAAINEIRQ